MTTKDERSCSKGEGVSLDSVGLGAYDLAYRKAGGFLRHIGYGDHSAVCDGEEKEL